MKIELINREEIQDCIFQLEQGIYYHQQWYNGIIRSLICRVPTERHDINHDAHKECRFGQWYYQAAPEKMRHHPGFIALGEEHLKMHETATKLLTSINNNDAITPYDYDAFSNFLERMRLELTALQKELNELLYNRDSLTGALNATNLLPMLQEQLELVKRKVQSCGLALFELDGFKSMDNRYGNAASNAVLAGVARFIIEHMRPYDRIFRLGNETFLLCFQNANKNLAYEMIERLRIGISTIPIKMEQEIIHITASFGIASIEAEQTVEQSLQQLEHALDKAKADGRNCTRLCD